jgi:hypothetical protein
MEQLPAESQQLLDWLSYGSYVDQGRRILYVETPKCGCSSVKYLLREMNQAPPLHFNPLARQTRFDMMVHDRGQVPLPAVTAFRGEALQEILAGEGWFRFCVVRNPVERFFSAWCEKIFLCEPGYEQYLPGDGRRHVEFADFFRRVVTSENPATCDSHWRLQSALLIPDHIAYSRIYDVRELGALPADLERHLETIGMKQAVGEPKRINEGFSVKPDGFVTPEVIAALRGFYAADYARFDFADPAVAFAEPRSASELVNAFTDAIFERNRMISLHHDWLTRQLKR